MDGFGEEGDAGGDVFGGVFAGLPGDLNADAGEGDAGGSRAAGFFAGAAEAVVGGVGVAGEEEDGFGGEEIEFAVVDAPEDVFDSIAVEAEVGGARGVADFLPEGKIVRPMGGEGIADEERVDVALLGAGEELVLSVEKWREIAAGGGGGRAEDGFAVAEGGVEVGEGILIDGFGARC